MQRLTRSGRKEKQRDQKRRILYAVVPVGGGQSACAGAVGATTDVAGTLLRTVMTMLQSTLRFSKSKSSEMSLCTGARSGGLGAPVSAHAAAVRQVVTREGVLCHVVISEASREADGESRKNGRERDIHAHHLPVWGAYLGMDPAQLLTEIAAAAADDDEPSTSRSCTPRHRHFRSACVRAVAQ